MTSKIKVDNINKVSDDSNIIKKCGSTITVGAASDGVRTGADNLQAADGGNLISQSGTTITLGASGDTVTLAAGASQSGFGRSGSVNWQTAIITADPGPAVSGVGYFTNTAGSAFNITLPASPSVGDIVAIADYANNWGTNAITLLRNGSNIEGATSDLVCNTTGAAITVVYADGTKGWVTVASGNSNQAADIKYVTATGGTITTSGDDKIHTFTGPGTFTISCIGNPAGSTSYSYHVIAGGGASGYGYGSSGGAGGYRAGGCFGPAPLRAPAVTAVAADFPITIGGGGTPTKPTYGTGSNGTNTVGLSLTAAGGGGGAGGVPGPSFGQNGSPGGSGGAASGGSPQGTGFTGGTGNTPPVSPPQGNPGAPSAAQAYYGQGGGAGGAGNFAGGPPTYAANPTGVPSTISGSNLIYASGGPIPSSPANRGNGGNAEGNNGDSGVVIIRYKFQN